MKRTTTIRFLVLACVTVLVAGLLAGCLPQMNGGTSDEQKANRTYMTKVNQAMEDLNTRLKSFDDAVSRGDAVTMRTQADNAFAAIDTLSSIDTPEAMKELQQNYVDGCNALKDALNEYINLYTDIESATEEHPFDYGTYDDRLKTIQDKYNEGIQKLKDADAAAVKLNGGEGEESKDQNGQEKK